MIRKLFYILFSLFLILAGIVGSSYVVNRSRLREWLAQPKAPGQLVDVGGRKVYSVLEGDHGPTIVIFPGLNSSSIEWRKIQTLVSTRAHVLVFDRPGVTWSEFPEVSKDSICHDLQKLIAYYHLPKPYILVGHSIGAYYVRQCVNDFGADLFGVLFLDPLLNPNTPGAENLNSEWRELFVDQTGALERSVKAAELGFFRFLNMTPYEVPKDIRDDVLNNLANAKTAQATLREYNEVFDLPIPLFPSVPVRVVLHSPDDNISLLKEYGVDDASAQEIENLSRKSAEQFAQLSPKSQIVVLKTGLFSAHLDQPDAVIREIEALLP